MRGDASDAAFLNIPALQDGSDAVVNRSCIKVGETFAVANDWDDSYFHRQRSPMTRLSKSLGLHITSYEQDRFHHDPREVRGGL